MITEKNERVSFYSDGTDLYHTLEIYLACSLYIHRNSLTYRLECTRNSFSIGEIISD